MGQLVRARHENRLDRTLQQLAYPRVLILDELGYLPLTREEARLFFRVERRDKADELAQTISEMPSVSHIRQKEPLAASR